MRILIYSRDEQWRRYAESGYRMCRESLKPLETDSAGSDKEFWNTLNKKCFDLIVIHGLPQQKISWGKFFSVVEKIWRETARKKKKYTWQFGSGAVALEEQEIYYICSGRKQIKVYTESEGYRITTTMKREAMRLPEDKFIRIHRNCLVNMEHINRIEGSQVILANGKHLAISARRKAMVVKTFLEYGKK